MKKLGAFLKSPVGRLHTSFSLFILFNLLSGFVNLFIQHVQWLDIMHFYAGLLILVAPLLYLAFSKNRRMVLGALLRMLWPGKADFQRGKGIALLFKAVTLLAVLLIIVNALCGIFMKFQLLTIASYSVHVFDFKALLALVPLHAALGAAMRAKRAKKPLSARRAGNGNGLKA